MNRSKSLIVIVFIATFLLLCPQVSPAKERLLDYTLSATPEDIVVSVKFKGPFKNEIEKDIKDGLMKEFFFYIAIYKKRPLLLQDEEISAREIKRTIKYDILKKQYLVTYNKDKGTRAKEEKIFEDYEEMMKWISKTESVRLVSRELLKPQEKYYISVRAEMKPAGIPFYLRYLFFFIPSSDFKTPWYDTSLFTIEDLKDLNKVVR